jgi:SAM-dependent methyltransferase
MVNATSGSVVQTGVETNAAWFEDNHAYAEAQAGLPLYRHMELMVRRELAGQGDVLDVGNGGFFNYDTALVQHVTAVDLFLADGPGPTPNSTFKRGSVLDLPFPDGSFDCALLQNVLHHVTGESVPGNLRNLARAIAEIARCVKRRGKVVIIESTVGEWFYPLEKLLFRPLLFLKRGGHPVTFQFTPREILNEVQKAGLEIEEYADVPARGLWILQFGVKWPTLLTPARPIKLVLTKR